MVVSSRRQFSAEIGICHMSETTITPLPDPSGFTSDPFTDVLRDGARKLIEQAIHADLAALMNAFSGERLEDGRARLVRHGHLPEREVMTGIGPVLVKVPRVRDRGAGEDKITFTPSILPRFSNWVFGSSSFSFLFRVIVTHPGHASLRSLVDAILAPLHAYVGSDVESLALRRASRGAADTFGFLHEPRPVRDDPVRIGCWRFRSCHASHLVLTEFRAINPHPVEQDGEFACDSHNGATTTLGAHQSHAPRFDLRPRHRSHQQSVGGCVQSCADIPVARFRYAARIVVLTRLVSSRRQAKMRANSS